MSMMASTTSHSHPSVKSAPQLTTAESYDMTPRTRKIVYLFLLAGLLFLGSVGAYVWYGFYLWTKIP